MAGFGLNLKLVLYLQSQCLSESLGSLNPPHRQAATRYASVYRKPEIKNINHMKNIVILLIILTAFSCGCGSNSNRKNDDSDFTNKLIGVWEFVETTDTN
jgi:hypothetical protein